MYKLLIAEDVRTVRETLVRAIPWSKLGIALTDAVGNGEEALARLKEEGADLLLTDIGMPKMDGLQLIEAAKAHKPDLRCIILSGLGEFEYARKAIGLQVRDYVLKPVDPAEIESVMAKAVAEISREREGSARSGPVAGAAEGAAEERLPNLAELRLAAETSGNGKKLMLAEQAVGYVRRNYGKRELALADVAAAVGLSEKYMNALVKEVTGSTINHLLIRFRMEEAARLLRDPANRIYEVCEAVGYADLDHFRESFKKQHGLTPTEYRNQHW